MKTSWLKTRKGVVFFFFVGDLLLLGWLSLTRWRFLVAFSMRMLGRCSITPAAVVALNISNEQYMNILA